MTSVRVQLPAHLRRLAGVGRDGELPAHAGEVTVEVEGTATVATVLDALEADHPALRGMIRVHGTLERRSFMRYFADGNDISLDPPDNELPAAVVDGSEPLRIVGAIAGG